MKTSEVKDGGPVNELAPRSIGTAGITGQNTLEFVSDLRLDESILPADKDSVALKQRFIYYKNKLHNVPHGLSFLTPESFEKAQYPSELVNSVTSEKHVAGGETMYEIGKARFGDDVTNIFFSAFSRGVYAADHTQLSMKAAFPAMWKAFKPKEASLASRPFLLLLFLLLITSSVLYYITRMCVLQEGSTLCCCDNSNSVGDLFYVQAAYFMIFLLLMCFISSHA